MNYYERYCGDYARDTAHLMLAEHGAYTLMLDFYYSTERPLQADHAALYRLCRAIAKPEQATVRKIADEFFPVGPDGLRHNNRADIDIAKAQKRIAAAKANGNVGGRPPKGNPAGYPQDIPPGSAQETQQEPSGPHMVKPPHATRHAPAFKTGKPTPSAAAPTEVCVPEAVWQAFRDSRRALKAPLTPRAEAILANKLLDLQSTGNDATKVVEQSIERGWKGLFPLDKHRTNGREPTLSERRSENFADISGRNHGRTIDSGSVDGAPVRAALGDLRQPDGDDVGRLPKG